MSGKKSCHFYLLLLSFYSFNFPSLLIDINVAWNIPEARVLNILKVIKTHFTFSFLKRQFLDISQSSLLHNRTYFNHIYYQYIFKTPVISVASIALKAPVYEWRTLFPDKYVSLVMEGGKKRLFHPVGWGWQACEFSNWIPPLVLPLFLFSFSFVILYKLM